ncbi:MAG: Wzz/FepE/Etk N-terminal domain-containing protein [Lutispora sp.]|nr:Wzz/FepE/Etk N-terminal domain-containing protein [Lutispora sp.]
MEYEEIDLRELFFVLRKRIAIILLLVIFSVAASGIVSYFVLDKQYQASTTIIVGSSNAYYDNKELQLSDITMYQKLLKTFSEIAKSRMVSEKVIKDLSLSISPDALQKKIAVTSVGDTQMMTIKVTDLDPQIAASIANKLANIFKSEVAQLMKVQNVEIIDPAVVPTSPIKPRPMLNMAIAFVLALMIGVGLAFLLEYLDHTVKTPDDVEKFLELPVLGTIPDVEVNSVGR